MNRLLIFILIVCVVSIITYYIFPEKERRQQIFLTEEDRKWLPPPGSGIEIYDTLVYINRQKLHGDKIYSPKVDSIKVGKGAWYLHYIFPDSLDKKAYNGAFRSNPCEYELPPKHEILQNTVTKKYCIGKYHNNIKVWSYFGAAGYTDTCKLKEDFLAVFVSEQNADEINSYYEPIKK